MGSDKLTVLIKDSVSRNSENNFVDTVAVIIKSSRRPWTLDRLLTSLRENLNGYEKCEIFVVDDRTDEKFLKALQLRFPEVNFDKRAIWPAGQGSPRSLPYVEAWKTAVEKCESEYFLILEDDQWLAHKLDLSECIDFVTRGNVWSLQLGISSASLVDANLSSTEWKGFDHYLPRIFSEAGGSASGSLKRFVIRFYTSPNWFVKKMAGLVMILFPNSSRLAWQSLAMVNPMCGAVFQRSHWLEIWRGNFISIQENLPISRIVKKLWATSRPEVALAVAKQKMFKTTFNSTISLTLGTDVNWDSFNRVWSEEWLRGNLHHPTGDRDWSSSDLARILDFKLGEHASSSYREWVVRFGELHSKQ